MHALPPLILRAALLLGILGGIGVVPLIAWGAYTAAGPHRESAVVIIGQGQVSGIAAALDGRGMLRSRWAFLAAAYATSRQGELRAGEYQFPARASLREILQILRTGRQVLRRVTIPEGFSSVQIAALLDATPGLSGETPAIPEGSFLPETYAYHWGARRSAIVRQGQAAMTRLLQEAWDARSPGLAMSTPRDLLVLASIVERETGRSSERAMVAGVFHNRLKLGWPLQADPTVYYAVSGGHPLERPLSRADLALDSPYNTYVARGLPPGPIAAPGRAAIQATARPSPSDYMFFVADGSGGHAFSRTLDEHNRHVARWREIERGRR